MPRIVGLDFSTAVKYRTKATVRLFDGKEVELPLIKVRDAAIAENFLHMNDNLVVQINTMQMRFDQKAGDAGRMAKELKDAPETSELNSSHSADVIETAMVQLYDMQTKTNELHKRCSSLCDEIHEFLTPYLEGTDVIEQLNNADYSYTITVLSLMLYGEEFLTKQDETEGSAEENPTITPSPNA